MGQTMTSTGPAFAGVLVAFIAAAAIAQETPKPSVKVDPDGTVHTGEVTVPLSNFLSPESKTWLSSRLKSPTSTGGRDFNVADVRQKMQDAMRPALDRWLEIYPSTIEPTVIAGVKTDVVTPKAGIDRRNGKRVLINVHGGGFLVGNGVGALIEAVPLAGRGKIKVVTIDYRMAPEHTYPAASEDVAAVYRELLKTYRPTNIGIYGCSAGGTLTAEAVAWFQTHDLPRPGVIGVFCSGAIQGFWNGGDSGAINALMNGTTPRPVSTGKPAEKPVGMPRDYFEGIDQNDPLISPGQFPEVLAKFPPTLLVTGTRDASMSNALVTHNRMLKAGVTAELYVQEGLGHGHFTTFPGTPETADAIDVIWRFFDRHLGK